VLVVLCTCFCCYLLHNCFSESKILISRSMYSFFIHDSDTYLATQYTGNSVHIYAFTCVSFLIKRWKKQPEGHLEETKYGLVLGFDWKNENYKSIKKCFTFISFRVFNTIQSLFVVEYTVILLVTLLKLHVILVSPLLGHRAVKLEYGQRPFTTRPKHTPMFTLSYPHIEPQSALRWTLQNLPTRHFKCLCGFPGTFHWQRSVLIKQTSSF
jgi:hypothetical protein